MRALAGVCGQPLFFHDLGLAFDFLKSIPGDAPVTTGHASGLITINVAETDDDYRKRRRESLRERYRTALGHLHPELVHYY